MARRKDTFWHRYKYKLNGLVLILPFWFLYQQLTPTFPAVWGSQKAGPYEITVVPSDMEPPYAHHGDYVKDFTLTFAAGKISSIRQGYVSIGPQPMPLVKLQQGETGILHGNRHSQHVHAIAPEHIARGDRLWLRIQDWQGEEHVVSWPMPHVLVSKR
ncbi:hypothetical protein [Lacimicrobium alkaliphilum]|uniref:Uncharacterized protein n=1 Tax=Lacimicrobium alkaliphilum TaxID=1526571 RepID=A0ABQ1R8K0_9ALTE|nr:hypothetical protein [Lacimicrobium alkaliphilum]GGD62168.1 hypothetical protein GCM10011357_16800 [Lacimicrobium alkaliphilum]